MLLINCGFNNRNQSLFIIGPCPSDDIPVTITPAFLLRGLAYLMSSLCLLESRSLIKNIQPPSTGFHSYSTVTALALIDSIFLILCFTLLNAPFLNFSSPRCSLEPEDEPSYTPSKNTYFCSEAQSHEGGCRRASIMGVFSLTHTTPS